jgi:hypothetical protein
LAFYLDGVHISNNGSKMRSEEAQKQGAHMDVFENVRAVEARKYHFDEERAPGERQSPRKAGNYRNMKNRCV